MGVWLSVLSYGLLGFAALYPTYKFPQNVQDAMNRATTNEDILKIGAICVIRDSDSGGAQRPRPYNKEKVGFTKPSYKKA